ncbi:hypothetical protein HID58_047355 [Brassica napus]|uniref:Gamma tubulin complex component protein N-terminal domain-containing protein n=2 Tax=Brassica napus TaxID=3708 RepID=A0ABQ8AZU7_BRANA|nr:hypothetical protein HID58_047355 [Brassica napus]
MVAQLEHQFRLRRLSLQGLNCISQPMMGSMRALAALIHQAKAMAGDNSVRSLLEKMTECASNAYLSILERWVYEGIIDDPYGKFFIAENKSPKKPQSGLYGNILEPKIQPQGDFQKILLPQGAEVILDLDEAEMRKQEEITKAKLAMERKKKLALAVAEKAAAKASIRAQKEAEKKEQKEREKAAKKKTGDSNAYEAISEEVPEASEAEKEEIEAPVKEKPKKEKKVLKEKPTRNRIRNRGGPETLPRPMLKRKMQTNYMVWAAPAAVVVLMLLVLGYYYVL